MSYKTVYIPVEFEVGITVCKSMLALEETASKNRIQTGNLVAGVAAILISFIQEA
jgi:hypothetical protein